MQGASMHRTLTFCVQAKVPQIFQNLQKKTQAEQSTSVLCSKI